MDGENEKRHAIICGPNRIDDDNLTNRLQEKQEKWTKSEKHINNMINSITNKMVLKVVLKREQSVREDGINGSREFIFHLTEIQQTERDGRSVSEGDMRHET